MKNLKKRLLKLFSTSWPLLLIVLLVFVFFWKFFIKGLIPIPGDFVVGVYYPWLDYKWGYAAGVPVKNPILADIPSFIYPMQTYAIDLLKAGKLPLWNPFILAGTPLLANFQSAPFSPTNFIYLFFDRVSGWGIQIVLQHLLSAIFTYFLLRRWKVSKWGSLLGGMVFAFSGFNLIWSQWNGHVLSAALIPLILLLEDRFLEKGRISDAIYFCLVLAFQIISGYPQILIYMSLAATALWLVRLELKREYIKKSLIIFLFTILSLGLTAFQILPAKELLDLSQRESELHPFEWAFLPFSKVITFLAPDYFGNHATGNYWGPQDYTSNTGFVGVIAFSLSLLAATFFKKRKEILFSILMAISSLILAFPTPISIFLWKSGFLGLNAASAHRSLVLWTFAISILSGFGFDGLSLKIRPHLKVISIIGPFLVLAGFGIYAFKIHQIIALRNLVLPAIVLLVSTCVILFLPKLKLILVFLSVLELFYFGWKFTPFSSRQLIFPTTPVIDFLKNANKPFRVVADRVIPINFLMNYQIETLEGYDAVYPKEISEFVAKINGNYGSFNSIRRYAIIDNYNSDLLDLANVKYLVIKKKDLGNYLKNKKFKMVFEDKSVVILENLDAFPRAFVEGDEKFKGSSVKFLEYGQQEQKILVETSKGGKLFVSNLYYPGWKAYVDGREVKIHRANYTFRAIVVPKGKHNVEFIYKPNSFYNGLKISIISLLPLIGVISYTCLKSRKSNVKS